MEYYVLASGSKGNCTVVKSRQALIIIDCGMTWKYLDESFTKHQINYKKADGLFITHSHSDHIAQLDRFKEIKKYTTFKLYESEKLEFYQSIQIKDLEIFPLALSHDSPNTTGYVIKDDNESLVYITDTGYLSDANKKHLKNADYYIMESNHDPVMLLNTQRPRMLKQRIMFDDGHLSNVDCANYLQQLVGWKTKEIVLAHLSEEANNPEKAINTINEIFMANNKSLEKIKVSTACQNSCHKGGKA